MVSRKGWTKTATATIRRTRGGGYYVKLKGPKADELSSCVDETDICDTVKQAKREAIQLCDDLEVKITKWRGINGS